MLFVSDDFELSKDKIVVLTKFYPQTKLTNTGNATANILKSKDGIHWLALTSLASNQSLDITLEEAFIYLTFKEDTTVYFQHQTPNHYHLDNEQNQLNARFDNLAVGGRNLLLNTQNMTWWTWRQVDTISNNHLELTQPLFNLGMRTSYQTGLDFKDGETITLSFEYRTDLDNLSYTYLLSRQSGNMGGFNPMSINNDGQWHRATTTATVRSDRLNCSILIGSIQSADGASLGKSGSYLEIRKIKLERGNIATDWTQAPEDLQSLVDALITRITALENR